MDLLQQLVFKQLIDGCDVIQAWILLTLSLERVQVAARLEALIHSRIDANGVAINYERAYGGRLDPTDYGFSSMRALLEDVPSLVVETQGGRILVGPAASDKGPRDDDRRRDSGGYGQRDRDAEDRRRRRIRRTHAVSYTHLTLPTNREV